MSRHISERPCGTPCRKASRNESQAISSLCRATLSVTSEYFPWLLDLPSIPPPSSLLAFIFQLGRLPSSDITRYHRYYAPIRHPTGPAEQPVDPNCRSPLGLPVLRLVPYACMLLPLPRQGR